MELIINSSKKQFNLEQLSVQQLLDIELPEKQKGIAIAIQNRVVPKSEWETTLLNNNDEVMIIKATQGG